MADPFWMTKFNKKKNKQNQFLIMQLPTEWEDSFAKKTSF